jgi:hypothetical protein
LQALAILTRHDGREGQPRGKGGRSLDQGGERCCALRPDRAVCLTTTPERWGFAVQRGVKIIAEGGGESGLIAPVGRHIIQRRGKAALARLSGQLRQAPRFGLEAAKLVFEFAGRFTGRSFCGCGLSPFGFSGLDGGAGEAEGFQRRIKPRLGRFGFGGRVGAEIGALGLSGFERSRGAGEAGAGLFGSR